MTIKKILDRKNKMLQMVVHQYIQTGKPVGSKSICENYNLEYSSATVRNILHDLESDGLILQPYTSAGRIPTDVGYRRYVDSLIEIKNLAENERTRIEKEYNNKIQEIEDVMMHTSKLLAIVSSYAGFVVTKKNIKRYVDHVEIVRVSSHKVLLVIVTDDSVVKHKVFSTSVNLNKDRVRYLSRFLNSKLQGVELSKVSETVIEELKKEEKHQKNIDDLAHELTDHIETMTKDNMLFLEGTSNIIDANEMIDVHAVKSIYKIVEEKEILNDLLGKKLKKEGINVLIGQENPRKEMKDCSLITTTCKMEDKTIGLLGIIGPKRMEYSKMIALVEFVSKILNKTIKRED